MTERGTISSRPSNLLCLATRVTCGWARRRGLSLAGVASTLAVVTVGAGGAMPGSAQDVVPPGSGTYATERPRGRTALQGAALGAALAATPVVLTSSERQDIGIALLLGLASGGATGAMLPLPPGVSKNRWKGSLVGLGVGSVVGGLTLALAWNDPSIEFETHHELAVGAVAGGAVGLIVGAVLGAASGSGSARERRDHRRAPPSSRGIRLLVSPGLATPGRWHGYISVPLP